MVRSTHCPTGTNERYKVSEYDEWVVQRRPSNVSDKHYDEHDWSTVSTGLSFEDANEHARSENQADYNKDAATGEWLYIFRVMPAAAVLDG